MLELPLKQLKNKSKSLVKIDAKKEFNLFCRTIRKNILIQIEDMELESRKQCFKLQT